MIPISLVKWPLCLIGDARNKTLWNIDPGTVASEVEQGVPLGVVGEQGFDPRWGKNSVRNFRLLFANEVPE